jgi:hypothetical protein
MNCRNHPEIEAVGRCAGCAEPFCAHCLVNVAGQQYCTDCKVLALRGKSIPAIAVVGEPTTPCKTASEALTYAIVAIIALFFCLGFIFGPIAVYKAWKAKREIAEDPDLQGSGKAAAAMIIGIIATVLGVLYVVGMVASAGSRHY